MKLFNSPTSPFVRKVKVAALELGAPLELIAGAANPLNRDQTIVAHNPTGRVPTAILDTGAPLYDSRVITRWLDEHHKGPVQLYPQGPELWTVLRREAMGDGLADATVVVRYETWLRPEHLRWPEWIRGQLEKVDSSLDQIETEAASFTGCDAGLIAIACAIGFLELRFADHVWRGRCPRLAVWYDAFCERPSMQATRPA